MSRRIRRLTAGTAVLAVAIALALVLSLAMGPATAKTTSGSEAAVCEALRQSLDGAGLSILEVTASEMEGFPAAYTVRCRSVTGQDPINMGRALQQAKVLAGAGAQIKSLRVQCVDASEAVVLDATYPVYDFSASPAERSDTGDISTLKSGLGQAIDADVSSLAANARRQSLSVGRDSSGLLEAAVVFVAPDGAAARKAVDAGLVQRTVGSCRVYFEDQERSVDTLNIVVSDVEGKVLLNYLEDLSNSDVHAYWVDEIIGDSWMPGPQPLSHFSDAPWE